MSNKELIKALRDDNACLSIKTAHEAADAIEQLQKSICPHYIRNVHDRGDDSLCRKYGCEVNALPRWIPVTERLPESGVHVLASCRVKYVGGGGRTYVCEAFHSEPKKETCCYSDGIDMEYDEETDEYYLPEGWWEAINNWDDYSFVAIGDFVTHWMPLPEPPNNHFREAAKMMEETE